MNKKLEIIHLKETISTNTYLKELLQNAIVTNGTIVYTDYQSKGRGQRGNTWESAPSENLLFSMVVYPQEIKAIDQFLISQIISLAIKDVLSVYTSDISIKWPNDIYWQEKKIAGILIENNLEDRYISSSIVGVGLNINQELFESDAPNPISLKQITTETYSLEVILKEIITKFYFYYKLINEQQQIIRNLYKKSLFRKNRFHWFESNNHKFKAMIEAVDNSGLLILKHEDETQHKYAFKEVKFLFDV